MEILRDNGSKTADVIIVGAGVIGLTIARELALRGVRHVILLERSEPGAEASSAAGGILAPQVEADRNDEFFQLACASRDMYPAFVAALEEEAAINVELDRTGTLYVGFSEHEEKELARRYQWQTSLALRVEWLRGDEVRRLEPVVAREVGCALQFPNDFQIENRLLIQALVRANEKLGVRLIANCKVHSLSLEHDRIRGVDTSQGLINGATVVIAAGAWSTFISCHSPRISIEPVRGQMLCFKPTPPLARHVMYSSRGYLVPRHDGRLLAGSTTEHAGFENCVTEEAVDLIKSMAVEIIPRLREFPLADSWAGLRPRAEDNLPVLGPSEDVSGLFFATGHYRNGILLAPITGKLIADAVVEGVEGAALSTFSPNRFRSRIVTV